MSKYALALTALALPACQGGFGSGGTAAPGGMNPPVNQQMPAAQLPPSPLPKTSGAPAATGVTGTKGTYEALDAAKGLPCPTDNGFSCTLKLHVITPGASASPSPSPSGSASPTASPTPTPTPTPTPLPSGSPSAVASASPTPLSTGPHIFLEIAGMPKNAPKMNDPDPKAVGTVALVTLRIHTDADITIAGTSSADFTLPKEQIGGRKFAVQLYQETVSRKKTIDRFIGNYNQSKLSGDTLHFAIETPPLQIKKNETWMLVLYGDETPSASSAPSASASPSASGSPSASPSAAPSSDASSSPNAPASPAAPVAPATPAALSPSSPAALSPSSPAALSPSSPAALSPSAPSPLSP